MKTQINAGTLRYVVAIHRPGSPDDVDSFGNTPEWVEVGSARVSIEPVSGREFQGSERLNAEVTHRIHMRARPDIGPIMPQWSLLFGARRFWIESVLDAYEVGHKLTLLCKELVE